ncbi:cardiolipin synthase [Neolewinella aurantiaca]|uniref:Cardiolipin synthase n=1 Tax=Neolewinella aurantiaca TaxID=2602767 RepID=A0A5C7FXF7_9BACT|nr:cardiolipin synthase [Neolewinella aurantiaca]
MNWLLIAQGIYLTILVATMIRIIYDTTVPSKTFAYLMLVVILPVVGIVFYYAVGTNMRKRRLYADKLIGDGKVRQKLMAEAERHTGGLLATRQELGPYKKLINLMQHTNLNPLTADNSVDILVNGEHKFPRVKEMLRRAEHHIHIEYYRFEDDLVGRGLEEILLERARAGVKIRLIYDDFGSRSIRHKMAHRLREAGAEVMPYYRMTATTFLSRFNYRNHRKVIVIDGHTAFVGGINVSEAYDNEIGKNKNTPFWRDTHMMVKGSAVHQLQYLFLNDWNFCTKDQKVSLEEARQHYFPEITKPPGNIAMQIAASGPDSKAPAILYSILQAIDLAEEELLITTPYFIPGQSLMDNICIAAGTGLDVRLMVPRKGDSKVVSKAAASYYQRLLEAGVRIFEYEKGFVHAKTLVVDRALSIVGTANLDIRSFDLNFEVNAIVYDQTTGSQMAATFFDDAEEATELTLEEWMKRGKLTRFIEKLARLMSPVL